MRERLRFQQAIQRRLPGHATALPTQSSTRPICKRRSPVLCAFRRRETPPKTVKPVKDGQPRERTKKLPLWPLYNSSHRAKVKRRHKVKTTQTNHGHSGAAPSQITKHRPHPPPLPSPRAPNNMEKDVPWKTSPSKKRTNQQVTHRTMNRCHTYSRQHKNK